MSYEITNPALEETLVILYSTCSASFIAIVLVSIYIVVFYLCKLESVSWMISAFYVLNITQCLSHSIFFALLASNPDRSPFYYDTKDDESKFQKFDIFELIGSQGFKLLSWLVVIITF